MREKGLVNLLKNRHWYHQGFDGSPMFLFAVGQAETQLEKRKPAGMEAKVRVCFFNHGKADWYLDMTDIKRGVKVMLKLAKKDPRVSNKLLKAWQKDESRFENFFWKEFPKIQLAALTDSELLDLWKKYTSLFNARFTSSSIIDHFALGTDELIAQMIRREIKKSLKKESDFVSVFSEATAPVKQSFINQAEIDLLKIALGKSKLSLQEYQKKYFWVKNNYVKIQELSVKHFEKELKALKQGKKSLGQQLRQLERTPKLNLSRKQKLYKKYKFSLLLKTLLKISEDFSWWQDERKKSTFLNIHIGGKILNEIGKRSGYNLEALKYAVAPEIPRILKLKQPTPKELRERMKKSAFIMTKNNYLVRTGQQAGKLYKLMFGSKKADVTKDFRGLAASLGRAIGRVKILKSAEEIGKVNIGDILVAVMTRPDYVPAMKKAAAIVTNEGGITSHAAIVSRELGIPCVIGTKIATEVLRDGDLVEVNANHGWIRKLN